MSPPTVEMKTRPILFGAPMIRAIMDDTKTQTRRALKPQPAGDKVIYDPAIGWRFHGGPNMLCPYGVPGDRLWVRETLRHGYTGKHSKLRLHYAADERPVLRIPKTATPMTRVTLPSIFMPRWASRITLEVTDVRVERVQDITVNDAIAEGVTTWGQKENERRMFGKDGIRLDEPLGPNVFDGYTRDVPYMVNVFAELWDSINAKRGLGWSVNPLVWCVTFRRVKP